MNKTFSKILSLILAVILTVGMFGVFEFEIRSDAQEYENNDWIYSLGDTDGFATIDSYEGTDAVVEIPSMLGGKEVKVIGAAAFMGNKTLKEVTIPSTVTEIRVNAFSDCTALKTVNMTDGVTSINESFKNTAIETITIPSTVRYLYIGAFAGCKISKILVEGEHSSILNFSFSTAESKRLNEDAEIIFKGLPKVNTDLSLRKNKFVFSYENGNYCYRPDYSDEPEETIIDKKLNIEYKIVNGEATIVGFHSSVTRILIIPDSLGGYPVTAIGEFAFSEHSDVGSAWNSPVNTSTTYSFEKIVVPEGVKTIGRYAFSANILSYLKEIVLPESLEYIGYCAFYNNNRLETITIPSGVKSIPDRLFYKCDKLKNVVLEDGVEAICDNALYITTDATELTDNSQFNVTLPDSIEYLGNGLFSKCNYVQKVTLPPNLKTLRGTFTDMTDLKEIVFNDCLQEIGDKTFMGCTSLTEVKLPDSVKTITKKAFQDCVNLEKFYMSENVKYIPSMAFYNCTSLTDFTWNAEEQKIEGNAFEGCSIKSFDFSKAHGISKGAFKESQIEEAKIGKPEYFTEEKIGIGAQSFMSCSELETVALGGNVDEVGSQAFAECENLETVIISDSVEKISDDAFEGSEKVTIFCFEDSYAETFAIENRIKVTTLVVDPIPNQTYTTKEIKPELTVSMSSQTLGRNEYSADYFNNINVGTASVIVTGSGKFDMLVSKADFAIIAKNITDVQISEIRPQIYTDTAVTPEVSVKYNGVKLKEGKDYQLSYENNNSAGTGTVKIKGIGNYKGTASVNFEITQKEPSAIEIFFNAIADFFNMIWNWFVGLFK